MASRPSTARKITPKVEADRKAALEQSESIRIDGVTYTIRPADITGVLEREFRRQTGMSVRGMMEQLFLDPGLDSFAGFLFLAKTMAGGDTTFDAELGRLDYSSVFDVVDVEAEPDSVPEA